MLTSSFLKFNKTLINHKILKKKKKKKKFQFFRAYITVYRTPPKWRRFGGCTLKINKTLYSFSFFIKHSSSFLTKKKLLSSVSPSPPSSYTFQLPPKVFILILDFSGSVEREVSMMTEFEKQPVKWRIFQLQSSPCISSFRFDNETVSHAKIHYFILFYFIWFQCNLYKSCFIYL